MVKHVFAELDVRVGFGYKLGPGRLGVICGIAFDGVVGGCEQRAPIDSVQSGNESGTLEGL